MTSKARQNVELLRDLATEKVFHFSQYFVTGVTSADAAMTATLTAAKEAGATTVLMPDGVFQLGGVTHELGYPKFNSTTPGAITVKGQGTKTVIKSIATGTNAIFAITGGNLNYLTFGGLQDLVIENDTFKSGAGCAVKIESCIGNVFRNVTVRNMKYAFWLYNGVQFGGAGWCEYNTFDNVVTDYCDECYRLEHNPANTNTVPSHGYNKWIHCLGNVFAVGGDGVNPQIFFHIVNDAVNFYNSDFDFYVNTQDGGILVQANGNGGAPLAAEARVGLGPSNTGSFHVESNSACKVTGNRTFWWKGQLSFVPANFYDFAGISVDYPGYSVFRCDNYEYSGQDLNTPASIDRFTDAVLGTKYPLQRDSSNSPFISADEGNKRGLIVYSDDATDAVSGLASRGATAKLQELVMRWWQQVKPRSGGSFRELGNDKGFVAVSDTLALTATATSFPALDMVDGAYTVYVKGLTAGHPSYVFSAVKVQDTTAAVINTLSAGPSATGSHTVALTWLTSGARCMQLAVSNAAVAGNYAVTVVGVNP